MKHTLAQQRDALSDWRRALDRRVRSASQFLAENE